MARYSVFSLLGNAPTGNRKWERVWRSPEPQAASEVIIVGCGGHGLAPAYYLAEHHGIPRVAVLEKGWLGSGTIGRTTTILSSIRGTSLWPAPPSLPTSARTGAAAARGCAGGGRRSRGRPTRSSSSAAGGTGSPPPSSSPRTTAAPGSRFWRRGGSAAARSGETRRSCAPTTWGPPRRI